MAEPTDVLIIGDSISMGYTPRAAERLADAARVLHNPGNGGDSANVAGQLDAWLTDAAPGLVHFNCGLHDIKLARDTRIHQVPLHAYRANLVRIVDRLVESGATLVWATTTPVIDERHHAAKPFDRHNRDVEEYNGVAADIMARAGIAVNDLHAAVLADGPADLLADDGVHFTEGGYARLADLVADFLRPRL